MNNDIIEKLQKILALTETGRGATQGEVEAAMARAAEIARKHGIEMASIPKREENRSRVAMEMDTAKELKTSTRYEHPYHNFIAKTLEDVFGVRFIIWKTHLGSHPYITQMHIVGEATDVAIVVALYPWLEKMFPKIFGEGVAAGRFSKKRTFADQNGCYFGLYKGIVERNHREEEKMGNEDRDKWALVVVDKRDTIARHVDENYKFGKAKQSHKKYSQAGYEYGSERGQNINLRQVSETGQRTAIS